MTVLLFRDVLCGFVPSVPFCFSLISSFFPFVVVVVVVVVVVASFLLSMRFFCLRCA